jgi:hypothetical protein
MCSNLFAEARQLTTKLKATYDFIVEFWDPIKKYWADPTGEGARNQRPRSTAP